MEWAYPTAGTLEARTLAMGDARQVRFKSPSPWLLTIAPWLPWGDDPVNNHKLLDYAPWAAVMWWALVQDNATAANTEAFATHVLSPSGCEALLAKLQASGFEDKPRSYAELCVDMQTWATQQRPAEALLDVSVHMETLAPVPARSHPGEPVEYATELEVCSLADETSGSYGPAALLEYFGAPRLTVAKRYDDSMPFLTTFKTLHTRLNKNTQSPAISGVAKLH